MVIKKVAVIGAGLMGRQIALNTSLHGYECILNDKFEETVEAAELWINDYLEKRVKKGKLSQDEVDKALALLNFESNLQNAVEDVDLVIEAIIEKEEIKKSLFEELDELTKKETILASNSSFIPSSAVAYLTKKPEKVANLHYFNPALVMKLVEVVKGAHTSDETANALYDFASNTGKAPIMVKKEIDGFVANRILSKLTQEALFLVEEGIVTPREVDLAVEKGLNHPMGPFRIMDLVGIDISYYARERRFAKTGNPQDKPPKFLEEKFKKGDLGRKTGKGWYDYD